MLDMHSQKGAIFFTVVSFYKHFFFMGYCLCTGDTGGMGFRGIVRRIRPTLLVEYKNFNNIEIKNKNPRGWKKPDLFRTLLKIPLCPGPY
jgi:hypothetical protein